MCKKIQKFFTVQLSWLNCLMSPCCGLEFFEIKIGFFCLCGRRNPRTALQLLPCSLLLSTCFRKIRIIPWYCLNCTMYSCMQFVPFYFCIWEYVPSICSTLRNQYYARHTRQCSIFLSESMVFPFRLFHLASIYLRSRGFGLLWVNAICLKCNFAFPYMH